ncbi:MAG: ligase-associated DNA damage response endonuclease PdeM [Flavobacteriales bacterium]
MTTFDQLYAMPVAEVLIAGERLLLHPYRALYWPRLRWLVVSDLHLGKAAHFRKTGAALPEGQDEATMKRLEAVTDLFRPKRLLILGDLFHSHHNNQWATFTQWAREQTMELHLVVGNHDILPMEQYADAGVETSIGSLFEGPFAWAHEPVEHSATYSIAGHIHPGVVLRGLSRERLKLPCFWFGEKGAILPAFGMSTGLFRIRPKLSDRVFVSTDRAVMDVSSSFHRATKWKEQE